MVSNFHHDPGISAEEAGDNSGGSATALEDQALKQQERWRCFPQITIIFVTSIDSPDSPDSPEEKAGIAYAEQWAEHPIPIQTLEFFQAANECDGAGH